MEETIMLPQSEVEVVDIQFRPGQKIYFFDPDGGDFQVGDHVIIGAGALLMCTRQPIRIGDHVMFGPGVTVATAGHPIQPELRKRGMQYNIPVHIGKNCWIGAGAVILPGVNIGDNVVIGAGSVVTKDIPSNVVAVGNPCRVLRQIGEHDDLYYFRDKKIPENL